MPTKISWTDESWNPVIGCSKVSAGCQNCYAEKMAVRLKFMHKARFEDAWGGKYGSVVDDLGRWNGKIYCDESLLDKPLHWRKPRRIFVCSMSDLFHPKVPFEVIDKVFDVIRRTPDHTYQILTKKPKRMADFIYQAYGVNHRLDNAWLGVSIENQKTADERIPILLEIPVAVRFVSVEPMLDRVDFVDDPLFCDRDPEEDSPVATLPCRCGRHWEHHSMRGLKAGCLDWVIIGCESGPKRRECKLEWVWDLVGQCKAAGVACFVKQLSINGKVSKNMSEWPEDLRLQQYPIAKGGAK